MNKSFDKILERLQEERELSYADFSRYVEEVSPCLDAEYDDFFHRGLERASRLVKEVAKEYNGGWIPCSERLPENISTVLVQVEEFESPTIGWYGNIAGWRLLEKDFDELNDFTVIAWQPLPPAYQPKGGES